MIVTGASSGIGRAISVMLSQAGAGVILIARDADRLAETASLMETGEHCSRTCDLSDDASVEGILRDVAAESGPIDGLVHAAGRNLVAPLRAMDLAEVKDVFSVNVMSIVALTKAFRRRDVRAYPEAAITVLSSVAATRASPGMGAYAASKAAVDSLVKTFAAELAGEGIRINAVSPGLVETPMTDALRAQFPEQSFAQTERAHLLGLSEPGDVAELVCFLLGTGARKITGQSIVADGGYSLS